MSFTHEEFDKQVKEALEKPQKPTQGQVVPQALLQRLLAEARKRKPPQLRGGRLGT